MALIQRTTPLTANQEYDSPVFQSTNVDLLTGTIFADKACTLFIEQSSNGADWDVSSSYAVTANDGKAVIESVVAPYFRVRLLNGSAAQTVLRLFLNARSPSGAYVLDTGALASPTEFFVVYFDGNVTTKSVDGPNDNKTFTAEGPEDANGLAALRTGWQGKFVAFNAATGVASVVEIVQSASSTPSSF